MQTLTLLGCNIRTDGSMVSLTDIWQIAKSMGYAAGKYDPRQWGRKPYARKSGTSSKVSTSGGPGWNFIDSLATSLNVNYEDIYKTSRGRTGGGTWAHKHIAVAYILYLGDSELLIQFLNKHDQYRNLMQEFERFEVDPEIVEAVYIKYGKDTPLYVYAIQELGTGNIKIGISVDPVARLKQLQVGNSSKLVLLATRKAVNGYIDEAYFHQKNLQHHIRGEWFTDQAQLH